MSLYDEYLKRYKVSKFLSANANEPSIFNQYDYTWIAYNLLKDNNIDLSTPTALRAFMEKLNKDGETELVTCIQKMLIYCQNLDKEPPKK